MLTTTIRRNRIVVVRDPHAIQKGERWPTATFFRTERLDNASLVEMDPKRSIDLTARAGYLATDKTFVYARAGYTNARLKTTITDGVSRVSDSKNHDGWLVGGGVEYAVIKNVSARLEYRYSDFSDGKYDRHQVLFGASYRF